MIGCILGRSVAWVGRTLDGVLLSAGTWLVRCLCQGRFFSSPRAARRGPAREAQVFKRGRASPWCLGGFPKPSTGPSDAITTASKVLTPQHAPLVTEVPAGMR